MLPVNCRINATALFRLRSSVSDSRNRETVISFSLDSQAWRPGKVAVAVIDAVLEQVSGQGTDGRLDGRSSLFRPISPALPSPPRATHPTRLARALAALTLCPLPSPPPYMPREDQPLEGLGMATDHVAKLEKAHDQLVAQRRSLAEALAAGYQRGR